MDLMHSSLSVNVWKQSIVQIYQYLNPHIYLYQIVVQEINNENGIIR
jgi:hypothetical protein